MGDLTLQTVVVLFVCYYSMFGRSCIIKFSTFGKYLFAFIFTHIIEFVLDKSVLEEGFL
jgi:hypothetical protein